MKYFSQYRQDCFIDLVVFYKKRNGFFVDIGAHDGVSFSNSYFLEKKRDWTGICFEPNPSVFMKLNRNRNSLNINCCLGNEFGLVDFWQIEGPAEMLSGVKSHYDRDHVSRILTENEIFGGRINEIKVPIKPFSSFKELKEKDIDFISLDTEGNEMSVLQSIDFLSSRIKSFSIENNYKKLELDVFLIDKGFIKLIDLGCDSLFILKELDSISLRFRLFLWNVSFWIYDFLSKKKRNFEARFRKFIYL